MSASSGTAPPPTFVLPPQSSPSPAGSPPPPDQINPTPRPPVATPPLQSPPPALTSPPPPTFSPPTPSTLAPPPPLGPPPPAPPSPLTPSDPPIFPPRSPAKPPGIPESPYPPPPTTIPSPESSPPPPRNAPPPPTTIPSPESSPPPPQPPRKVPAQPESSPPPPQPPRKTPAPPESSPPPPQPPRKTPAPPESSPPPPQPTRNAPPPPQNTPPPNSEPQPTPSPPPFPRLSPPSFSPPISSLSPPSKTNADNSTGYSDSPNNSQSTKHGEGIGTAGTAAITSLLTLLLLGLLGAAACCVWKRKRKSAAQTRRHIVPTSINTTSTDSDSGASNLQRSSFSNGSVSSNGSAHSTTQSGGIGGSRSGFTYDELVAATNGFPQNNLLGEGGFGSVYKGKLPDGREVAVKQLKIGARQGEREFRSEVDIISRIHHRHLVSLLGYCVSESTRLLVYEYVPNNTLYFHLHGQGRRVMNWATRVKIAVGAARGIAYLHEDCQPRVIHRDIKSSNILLDYSFDARVSDFGLAKLAMDCHTHVTTRVMGTFGYMAPEYASSGKLTEKSDVYSFGVVLLELITGRKPVDTSQPLGEESLVEWARPLLSLALHSQEFGRFADPRLEENYLDSEMLRMVEAAAACIRHSSTKRPQMGQIVRAFDSIVTKDLSDDSDITGESEIFISAPQSEEDTRMFEKTAFCSEDYTTDYFSQNSWTSRNN